MGFLYTRTTCPTSGDYSALMPLPQLFSGLEGLLIHTSELYDGNPTPRVPKSAYSWVPEFPLFRFYLLPVHLASRRLGPAILVYPTFQLRFFVRLSSERPARSIFPDSPFSRIRIHHLLQGPSLSFLASHQLIVFPTELVNASLRQRKNLQGLAVGPFEKGRPPLRPCQVLVSRDGRLLVPGTSFKWLKDAVSGVCCKWCCVPGWECLVMSPTLTRASRVEVECSRPAG